MKRVNAEIHERKAKVETMEKEPFGILIETQESSPSIEKIQAEAQLTERLLQRTLERIDASDCDLTELLHLEMSRAEQQAYLAGLMFALGCPTILDRLEMRRRSVYAKSA